MALTQRLDLRQTQALVMTPQLQQAIKLLQLSNMELSDFIETELEQNPLLERDDGPADGAPAAEAATPDEPPASDTTAAIDGNGEADDHGEWRAAAGEEGEGNLDFAGDPAAWQSRQGGNSGGGDLPGIDQTLSRPTTLRDHLLAQVSLDIDEPAARLIASHLVDLVDEAGYLQGDLAEVAERLECDVADVEATLTRLQRFDPPGVFARNLAECLSLQLKDRDRLDPAMQALLANLPLLANRDGTTLMRLCGVDAEDLTEMVAEVKALNPKPGLAFDSTEVQPVVPDVIVRPQGAGWAIELNGETLPRVLVNNRYYSEISGSARGKADKDYLAERYQQANWLVKALHQRATTILKVATEIVRQQDGFFRHGVRHLKPLVLRDIAEVIAMHESTVSRVTSNKYMATPRGIYELKYFFTSSIAATGGGDALSAEAVRFRIKGLILAEGDDVLSDERIVDILVKEGIDIARRTVAKYREAMHIPSSVQRRRERSISL
ncbi:MAG TPA: RNA polymerase factor sigma-54 [Stellaceae bacterium]|nr:RNA polymerase factor sigma-54 [Stellaceae bacterium]